MSAKKDAISNVSPAATLLPQAVAAAVTNATGVEVRGYEEVGIEVIAGTCTDGEYSLDIEESEDNSTWTNVATADIDGTSPTISSSNDDQIFKLGYMGGKRYIRVNVAEDTNGTTGVVLAIIIHRRRPHLAPVS